VGAPAAGALAGAIAPPPCETTSWPTAAFAAARYLATMRAAFVLARFEDAGRFATARSGPPIALTFAVEAVLLPGIAPPFM
jgi:hypothetical protein